MAFEVEIVGAVSSMQANALIEPLEYLVRAYDGARKGCGGAGARARKFTWPEYGRHPRENPMNSTGTRFVR